ncbi:hypothetical protein HPB48_026971 [Haemaphysalis longicornis]|uniref:Uncharacterized protein n=1 Tax=Haemaphysalis longicornis TaxID=44386 RepID=A0A9J6HC36_HAELO|nr:hypothetical protein HPB48_026971 [Haemaphysalis longicornis]
MVLAADGLHLSFGGVLVRAWNLYTFLLELRCRMFVDWQDYASPSPARETQQDPRFTEATLKRNQLLVLTLTIPLTQRPPEVQLPFLRVQLHNWRYFPHADHEGRVLALKPFEWTRHHDRSHPSYTPDDESVPALAPPQSSDGVMDARHPSYPQRAPPGQHRRHPCRG